MNHEEKSKKLDEFIDKTEVLANELGVDMYAIVDMDGVAGYALSKGMTVHEVLGLAQMGVIYAERKTKRMIAEAEAAANLASGEAAIKAIDNILNKIAEGTKQNRERNPAKNASVVSEGNGEGLSDVQSESESEVSAER